MNKMIKGAAVTGVGIALLLGGGGTLAVWNAEALGSAGSVVAGDLNLEASGTGHWQSNLSSAGIQDIASYRIVPGETLTYAQSLKVTLVGDELEANLTATGVPAAGIGETFAVSTVLTDGGEILPDTVLTSSDGVQYVTALTTFEFSADATGREGSNKTVDLSGIGYKLEQIAPDAVN